MAFKSVRVIRKFFDMLSGYDQSKMSENQWINRFILLETIAGVPGMVGGMTIHLKSLTSLKDDKGVLHHLLEEAENERTHLFLFLHFKNPGIFFRLFIAGGQAVFWNLYFIAYFMNPKFAYRFVGYLEEEAVHTYTVFLK